MTGAWRFRGARKSFNSARGLARSNRLDWLGVLSSKRTEKSLPGPLLQRQIGGALKPKKNRRQPDVANNQTKSVEVFILAGGLSTRMGRDKAKIRLRGRTLLAWVRSSARNTGWPVRVIRRDLVPRCGPLGGVWTALSSSRATRLVFLSCDMPFVTVDLIRAVAGREGRGAFMETEEGAGFPFALDREAALSIVSAALQARRFSLQALARSLRARRVQPSKVERASLQNLNTPEDYTDALSRLERRDTGFDTPNWEGLNQKASQPKPNASPLL